MKVLAFDRNMLPYGPEAMGSCAANLSALAALLANVRESASATIRFEPDPIDHPKQP